MERLLVVFAVFALITPSRTADGQRLADLPRAASVAPMVVTTAASFARPAEGRLALSRTPAERKSRVGRGALWGLAIYTVLAGGYVIREAATCKGPDCLGAGEAWIGFAAGFPIAAAIGAGIGALWPQG